MDSENHDVAETVKTFYDDFGWQTDQANGVSFGELLHQDLDETAQQYRFARELRYRKFYREGGRFFLDAGCGSEPRRQMAEKFQRHLSVDISITGLQGARERLGDSGDYVMADLAALPFRDRSLDGVLASHCLYHVAKDQQSDVLNELYRVTKPSKNILIFYSSHYNLVSILHQIPKRVVPPFNRLLNTFGLRLFVGPPYLRRFTKSKRPPMAQRPPLYSSPQNPKRLARGFPSSDVTCLMTLTIYDTKLLRGLRLLRPAIQLFNFLETTFPHAMVYIGKFTCIRIQVVS